MSTSRFTVEAWSISDAGEIGGENEDTILVFQPENPEQARFSGSLYIIADGDGGGEQGRLASSYAARRVAADYFDSSEIDLGYRLKAAIQQANRDLYEYAQTRPELVKLTTTIVAAAVRGEQLSVASVGDSRAYLVRDGRATQITRDHTLVQQLLDEGAITPEEAAHHPRRDVVLRTLGAEEEVAVDVHDMRLRADDALVLTSDGLTSRLSMEEIERVVATSSPRNAADSLIQRAKLKGGKHNTSVVTALMREGAPPVNTNIPHRWDGSPPTFTAPPTLPGTPGQGLDVPDDFTSETQGFDPDVTAPNPVPTRPDDWSVPSQPPPQESQRAQPAPPYEQQVEPAPQRTQPAQPLSPQQTQPMQPTPRQPEQQPPGAGYQPPPGYQPMEVDPATGLPPTPTQPYQPPAPTATAAGFPQYGPRGYDPQQAQNQRRGVPVGVFLGVGAVAMLLTIGLIVTLLVNPFGLEIGALGNGGAAPSEETLPPETDAETGVDAEETDAAAVPTEPAAEPTEAVPTIAPTTDPAVEAPPGMTYVGGGPFLRGVSEEEVEDAIITCINEDPTADNVSCLREYFIDAQPQQEVTLTEFYIDQTEVTNQEYAECVAAEVCSLPGTTTFYDDPAFAAHPVVFVSWQQAVNYCSFQGKRLPTEAEWEKAARWDELVEEAYIYPWGDIYEAGRANTLSAGQGGTSAVGAFSGDRSPYGVLDMAGNVTEWVSDWYFPGYAERGTLNPQGPETQPLINPIKVARGGSFLEFQSYSRAGHRFEFNITSQSERLGFRCVQDIVGAAEPEAPAEPTEEEPVEETPVEESPQDTEAPTATPEP